jgi:hypothetical protein
MLRMILLFIINFVDFDFHLKGTHLRFILILGKKKVLDFDIPLFDQLQGHKYNSVSGKGAKKLTKGGQKYGTIQKTV